ncbi:NAD(P)/FAD-dependent oxidoreductase [Sphingopyxis alaskensis]|jgi:gamma-glutamylputrescine oxidase|uniref:FAD dependent oxidoreductase n=1 Tax=Sphingopyxis alaskensis (strain DSM 13593 / LMG 18877 / RB2256) TaxID=317655 RepID=Q1GU36_SPHAL|nr:FAD-binding oxidoreductase [Sphingopyxis alaskensis]ABF52836.1 FAD dependent oxidoreductase [Sphingopyxis alaskensis RB2256]MCM3419542.1 FAD-binding oxidoreductase [Sphingopyxis alaskensis]
MSDPLNHSYYAATAHEWRPRDHIEDDFSCDVAVIGGGFTGLSAALACAERGFSVILVEAEHVGFGASGRNGGQLIPGLRWTASELDTEFGHERADALFDLCWRDNRVKARIAKHGIDCDLKSGHLEAAWTPGDFDAMRREADYLATRFGYETEVVEKAGMDAHVASPRYHGGVYDARAGHFHPLNYAVGLAKAAEAAGVRIFEGRRATSIRAGDPGQLLLGKVAVEARYFIDATDSWIGDLEPDLGRYTVPIMNYNIATAPLANADELLPSDAAVADSRFVLNYFRLSADKRLIFGGGERYSQTPPRDIAAFVRPFMTGVFPQIADAKIDYGWGGAVGVTMNRLPHIGRRGNMFFAHGFSGHGALVTTLAGELIAEAMAGTAERFDLLANLPSRPFPGGNWLQRPLATLGLLFYALKDRLG